MLIVGIIPGPLEPSYSEINSYLRPLVKELNSLWTNGFTMLKNGERIVIHAALLATVCDVPATAKIGGFVGHASKHACWKCSKVFPYDPSLKCINFSGVHLGPLWDHDTHKQNALETLTAATPTQQSSLELDKGSRFTQLAEQLYGSNFLTINTHLHLHLQNVFKDYGPCYGYWLFSF